MATTLKQPQVKTVKPSRGDTPRLPHERDESHDSQPTQQRKKMKQAHDDIASGQVDTDLRRDPGVDQIIKNKQGRR
jgi:hypothetical protein